MEGLFALYWPEVRALLDAKVYITAAHEVCLERRIYRDVGERGRTEEPVRSQYAATVQPLCDLHVAPSSSSADMVLSATKSVKQSVYRILGYIPDTAQDGQRRETARAGLTVEAEEVRRRERHLFS